MKYITTLFMFFLFMNHIVYSNTVKDFVFANKIVLSDSEQEFLGDFIVGHPVNLIDSNDDIIFYRALIGVINPQKKLYDVELSCVDKNDRPIYHAVFKRKLYTSSIKHLGNDVVKEARVTLGLDPKKGAMISGQLRPLEDQNDYFIKFYFDKKLIGISHFRYIIKK